ncbi:hypothetical protein B0H19DRAFT_1260243 [Mycena capillaripes]|nr:hypothetical protein B0H19DRAFT_1260243 [Mycena capillaripes]
MAAHPDDPTSPSRFSDEIILQIFEHLTDGELLSLVVISQHIHDLALLSHLSRYGITETNIATNSFPPLSTSGAFPAFCLARFIAGVEALRVQFDPSVKLNRDVRALENLVRRLPPIKSINLDFLPRRTPLAIRAVRLCDIEGLMLALIAKARSHPVVSVSPFAVSIIRPHKPRFSLVRRIFSRAPRTAPLIRAEEFRKELVILPLMRMGGVIPSISLRALEPPDAVGTLIVFRDSGISNLRIPSSLRLSVEEATGIFENLRIPLLRGVEAALVGISGPSLRSFLCRHPTLERLVLRWPNTARGVRSSALSQEELLPPDVLGRLEHILGNADLLRWMLASTNSFPQLTVVVIELHKGASTREDYLTAMRGLARRSALDTLALHIYNWYPWDPKHFDAAATATAPEREASHLVDLRLTFKFAYGARLQNIPSMAAWLRLFPGLQKLSLFDAIGPRGLDTFLAKQCPQLKFTSYQLGK